MEEIMARQIVVESGTDHTDRPMIAVYGCYFPDPAHADYDKLREVCLKRLEPFSEMDYVLVFFAAPMEHEPSLGWMYNAYKLLARKYKKNIKKLYVIFPSRWFRILIWIMSKVFSHKFAAKIELLDHLEDLERMIPLDKVHVPAIVSGFDRGLSPVKSGENEAILPAIKIFGAEVERAAPDGAIPNQIQKVVDHLTASGLVEEGLFRYSPDAMQVEQIRLSMDRDYDIDLNQFSPHALASALKAYFRSLPTPLLPPDVYDMFGGVFDYADDYYRNRFIREKIFPYLTKQRLNMLGLIIILLRKTANKSNLNKMRPKNLAAVWTPNLIRYESPVEEMEHLALSQKFVEVLIEQANELFGDGAEEGEEEEQSE